MNAYKGGDQATTGTSSRVESIQRFPYPKILHFCLTNLEHVLRKLNIPAIEKNKCEVME